MSEGLERPVLLDRDGVLNRAVVRDGRPYPPATVEGFEILPGAAEAHAIDLSASYMVGDRWRDVEAGRRAGCRTIFIDRGYRERCPDPPADHDAADLSEAADWILSDPERRTTP